MKFNKKITVVSLSTVLGLGLVGSITGAVAWYQYSTRTTSSIIGTSTGESGVLQIKSTTGTDPQWKRDLITADVEGDFNGEFLPVTFGGFSSGSALPAQAYSTPVAGEKNMLNWQHASAGNEYLQYSFNLKAEQLIDGTMTKVAKDVYLTDITIQNGGDIANQYTAGDHDIADAVRIYIDAYDAVADEHKYFLISNAETSLDTHGYLDLDGDGDDDVVGGYEWAYDNTKIDYGRYTLDNENHEVLDTTKLVSIAKNDNTLIATKDGEGRITAGTSLGQTATGEAADLLITVTIWNEGWAKFGSNTTAMWGDSQRGAMFNVGFTFDVGSDAFRA